MKRGQIPLFIILLSFIFLFVVPSNSEGEDMLLFPLYMHSESNIKNNYNLTATINSQILKWDSILSLKISLEDTITNKTIPNSNINLNAFVTTIFYLKVNFTLKYNLLSEYLAMENGTIIINKFIPHVPTLFPYILEVEYKNSTENLELFVSFPFLIISEREPMISFLSFEMFIIIYFMGLIILPLIIIINNKKSKRNSKMIKNDLSRKKIE